MPKLYRGDVVIVHFPYEENPLNYKIRPALVIREDTTNEYLICMITSRNRSDESRGFWVLKDSVEGGRMGIKSDSFIYLEKHIVLDAIFFNQKIGSCSMMDDIDDIMDEIEE